MRDRAIESLKKTLELDPNFSQAHNYLGYAYAAKGMHAEAIVEYHEVINLDPGFEGLHEDPRFKYLMIRVGLTQ